MEETTDSPRPAHEPVRAVNVNVSQGRQARDRAQFTRVQKGHSLILHLTLGALVLWIPAIYISVSPNHYWHA
ncbi:membrane protein [Microbacterium phage Juicer]|nr:membrane protein [Microbacterium phage Juicer]